MKNINTFILTILIGSVAFNSCKKSETDSTIETPTPSMSVTATIDGTPWNAKTTTANLLIDSGWPGRTFTLITADTTKSLSLAWVDDKTMPTVATGHHDFGLSINDVEFNYTIYYNGNSVNDQVPVEVNFDFTSVDNSSHLVSGTFNSVSYKYNTTDTLRITNGVFKNVPFSISYQ